MADVIVNVTGLRSLKTRLAKVGADIALAEDRGLFEWGESVLTDARVNHVPVDLGTLRNSGFVLTATLRDLGPQAQPEPQTVAFVQPKPNQRGLTIGFGGPAAHYALVVHEGGQPHFPPHAPIIDWASRKGLNPFAVIQTIAKRGTRAFKYLQTPFQANLPRLVPTIAASMRRMLASVR